MGRVWVCGRAGARCGGGAKPPPQRGAATVGPSKKLALRLRAEKHAPSPPSPSPRPLTHQTARARPARTADARRRRPWAWGNGLSGEKAVEKGNGGVEKNARDGRPATHHAKAATLCTAQLPSSQHPRGRRGGRAPQGAGRIAQAEPACRWGRAGVGRRARPNWGPRRPLSPLTEASELCVTVPWLGPGLEGRGVLASGTHNK